MKVPFDRLVSKLSSEARECLELALGQALAAKQAKVELEHLVVQLLDRHQGDLRNLCTHLGIETEAAVRQLNAVIRQVKGGHRGTPTLSARLTLLFDKAWILASLVLKFDKITSVALMLAAMEDRSLAASLEGTDLHKLPSQWREGDDMPPPGTETLGNASKTARDEAAILDRYTRDLTAEARAGKLAPVVGREDEISQIIDILIRQKQNNPILVGDAGVGKTAVMEGFAQRIACGDVPKALQDAVVRSLDLGLLQAGTGLRGAFEERLKNLVEHIQGSLVPIILFIDEVHMLVSGGDTRDHADAANLIKPALARGELRAVGATTWTEYRKTIEADAALCRRFQMVRVAEPNEKQALHMLRAAAEAMARHHGLTITEEAVREAVHLSRRYLTGQQLPDKAVRVLDTACTRTVLARESRPPELVTQAAEVSALESELLMLACETERPPATREELLDNLADARERLTDLETRWQAERTLVQNLEQAEAKGEKKLAQALKARMLSNQNERPLVPFRVDAKLVAAVISGWTGIPMGKMLTGEIERVLTLKEALSQRVIGQDGAMDVICRRIASAMAELADPGKPVGVFLLIGPSGIGKTETAHALASLMFGGERNLVTINMSEFQESHSVSALKGAPPGYVGYGKGGILTEAVRRAPYSVVLLDEVEKAHPDVMEVFFQVFDKGYMEDGEGRIIDFKNTAILLTSNLGSRSMMGEHVGREGLRKALSDELDAHFHTALLGRLIVVPFQPLSEKSLNRIIALKLNKVVERLLHRYHAHLVIAPQLVELIAKRCRETQTGARNVDHILTQTLLPELSLAVLTRLAKGESFQSVEVTTKADGLVFLFS